MKKITYSKDDLIKKLSNKILFSNEDMKFMVDNFLETILEILKQPKDIIRIELRNFGVFEIQVRKARIGRNPNKPEKNVVIPTRAVVKFKAGKELKANLTDLDLDSLK